jgi:hypothetical protein
MAVLIRWAAPRLNDAVRRLTLGSVPPVISTLGEGRMRLYKLLSFLIGRFNEKLPIHDCNSYLQLQFNRNCAIYPVLYKLDC